MKMVDIEIDRDNIVFTIIGPHKFWSFKNRIQVHKDNIRNVYHDQDAGNGIHKGIRLPGTHIPGVITAGTFRSKGKKTFWDVTSGKNTIVVELDDGPYDRLVIDVMNPDQAISLIRNVIGST